MGRLFNRPRRGRARRALGVESFSRCLASRALRFEAVEPRLLLTHSAPELNPAGLAAFTAIQQNEPIASNTGQTVNALIASGGSLTTSPPLGNNFAFFGESNGALEGIAITALTGADHGAWQYSTNGGATWSLIGNVSAGNALLLSGNAANDDLVRFLPNIGFAGDVSLAFDAWDGTDSLAAGSHVNLSAPGATGGDTAYSAASADALLQVASAAVPPSFNLVGTADTVLENNTDGNPGGSDAGTITVGNVVTDIAPGSGGASGVTFTVTDTSGRVLSPAIDGDGTLTFQLAQNVYGAVTLNVEASNGALSTTKTTTLIINQTTPPSFAAPNETVVENSGAATYANWAQSVSAGVNGSGGQLTYTIVSDSLPRLFSIAPAINSSGTLSFSPASGQIGQATISAVLYNSLTKLNSATSTFTIGVYGAPSSVSETYVMNYASGGGASSSVLSHDGDPNAAFDGGSMTAQLVNYSSYGSMYLESNGTFGYAPGAGFQGYDQFTYRAVVGPAASAVQTVTLYSHEAAMVSNVFSEVLGHGASNSDIAYWAPQLHSGLSMGTFGGDTITSAEHLNSVVTGIFNAFLGRGPSQSDLSYWDQVWINQGGPEQVIVGIAGTQECFNHAQAYYGYVGDGNTNWLKLIYPPILNRPADSGALSYFTSELDNGYMTRAQVLQALVTSNEYRTDVINNDYNLYLHRAPTSSDQSYWLNQFTSGANQLTFQESLIGSSEYLGNPAVPTGGNVELWTW